VAFRSDHPLISRQQLVYLDPTSGHETSLTAQDCNAYAPAWATTRFYTRPIVPGAMV